MSRAPVTVILSAALGASSAGLRSSEPSCVTTGFSAWRQKDQFQPWPASSGEQTCVMCPPKNVSPRAPLTIASNTMNRS